jgi:hypothetical protein
MPGMREIVVLCALLSFAAVGCQRSPAVVEEKPAPKIVIEKERREVEPPLPPEVKIKLKRDGKENYSWELSGSDPDQILKVNEKFRRGLTGEQTK